MEKIKRRRFVKDVFCWSTALAAAGWLSQTSDPQPNPTPKDSEKPKDIPVPDVQPCYGVAVPPKKPQDQPPKKD